MNWLEKAIEQQQAEGRALADIVRDIQDFLSGIGKRTRQATGAARKSVHGREPGTYVVIDRRHGYIEVRIGKALWRALSMPPRFDIQRVGGGTVVLIPIYRGDEGFQVSSGIKGAPRIRCKSADDLLPDDGRYAGDATGGTKIIIGEKL